MPFIVLASTLVGAAVLGLVMLHVLVDQASFRVTDLQSRITHQQAALGQLKFAESVAAAPQRIASGATQLGLVPAAQLTVVIAPGPGSQAATVVANTAQPPRPAAAALSRTSPAHAATTATATPAAGAMAKVATPTVIGAAPAKPPANPAAGSPTGTTATTATTATTGHPATAGTGSAVGAGTAATAGRATTTTQPASGTTAQKVLH